MWVMLGMLWVRVRQRTDVTALYAMFQQSGGLASRLHCAHQPRAAESGVNCANRVVVVVMVVVVAVVVPVAIV